MPLLLLPLLMSGAACGGRRPPAGGAGAPSGEVVVAAVAGVPVSAGDVVAEVRRGGGTAREALGRLIDFQLLAAAAESAIGAGDPDVKEARDQAAVERMIERELEPRLAKSAIPDDVLRDLYQKALSAFVHPRLVEIGLLCVYTGARMKDEARAESEETARALERYVRARPSATLDDWKALAAAPQWHDRKVKFARLWQGLDEPFSADVGRAVAALQRPGDTTPLIVSESGCYLARYISERPPENVTFDQARDQLRDRIAERWSRSQFLEFAQAAANPHRIEGYPERFIPAAP